MIRTEADSTDSVQLFMTSVAMQKLFTTLVSNSALISPLRCLNGDYIAGNVLKLKELDLESSCMGFAHLMG